MLVQIGSDFVELAGQGTFGAQDPAFAGGVAIGTSRFRHPNDGPGRDIHVAVGGFVTILHGGGRHVTTSEAPALAISSWNGPRGTSRGRRCSLSSRLELALGRAFEACLRCQFCDRPHLLSHGFGTRMTRPAGSLRAFCIRLGQMGDGVQEISVVQALTGSLDLRGCETQRCSHGLATERLLQRRKRLQGGVGGLQVSSEQMLSDLQQPNSSDLVTVIRRKGFRVCTGELHSNGLVEVSAPTGGVLLRTREYDPAPSRRVQVGELLMMADAHDRSDSLLHGSYRGGYATTGCLTSKTTVQPERACRTRVTHDVGNPLAATHRTHVALLAQTPWRNLDTMKNIMWFVAVAFAIAASGGCDQPPPETCSQAESDFRSGWHSAPNVVASFTPGADHPEGVAVDKHNNVYISMALSGEILKVTPSGEQSTLAHLDLGDPEDCPPGAFAIMGSLAIDAFSNLYIGTAACDPEKSGLWRISSAGQTTKIATLPQGAWPNGVAYRSGYIYVADSLAPRLFRAPAHVSTASSAEVWVESPLLEVVPQPILTPGANGVQFFLDELYVTNSSQGTIVVVPLDIIGPQGYFAPKAGTPYVKFGPPESDPEIVFTGDFVPGCDDFAFNVLGEIYCPTNPFHTLLHINRQGHVTTIASGADGLDGPTAVTFGRKGKNRTLYITNGSFPFFESTGHGPSLMSADTLLPGYPLR